MGNKLKLLEIYVEDLKPDDWHLARFTINQILAVGERLREFGFIFPVLITKNRQIVSGSLRVEAAKLVGIEVIPCAMAYDLPTLRRIACVLYDRALERRCLNGRNQTASGRT